MRCQIRRGENNEKKLLILLITVGLIGTGAFAYFKYEEIQVRNDLIYSLQNESVQTAKGRVLDLNDKQLQKMNATISEVLVTQIYDGFIKSQPKKIANAFAISKLITIDKNDWKYSVISVGQSLPGLLEKVNLMEQSQACSDENNWRRELFGSYSTTAIMDLADYVSTGYNFYYNSAIDYYEKAMDIDYISCMNTEDDLIGEQYLILNALYSALTDYSSYNVKKQIQKVIDLNNKNIGLVEKSLDEINKVISDFENISKKLLQYETKIEILLEKYNK